MELIRSIRKCTLCAEHLPFTPRPIVQFSVNARIAIIGQAPGLKVQESGIAWNDASGNELRRWMQVSKEQFYNPHIFAIIPMGFCYPGRGNTGDLPPRPECAPLWHQQILETLTHLELILLIGKYSQSYYLPAGETLGLTQTVKNYSQYLPQYFPLIHPSPRNKPWHKQNPWFEKDVVPALRLQISNILPA